jgi:pimeloyl-ACP methyl ester carboxylesterase
MFATVGRWLHCAAWCSGLAFGPLAYAHESEVEGHERSSVLSIDHGVPHISTIAANAGDEIRLFVRERVRLGDLQRQEGKHGPPQAVLMIHGRTVPVLAAYALVPDSDYDWAWSLAKSGLDVFMLDFQGSGLSPRPTMDNPCNVPAAQRASLLVPNRLAVTCSQRGREPSYPFVLTTEGSDLDELDTVVDYIRSLRGVEKVHLVSWGQGSFRVGPYAVQHPEKVASLFLGGPIFNTAFPTTTAPPDLPRSGTPMTLRTRADHFRGDGRTTGWDVELKCENQREPGIEDVAWAAIMENDEVGRTWGPPPAGTPAGSLPEGVMRVREATLWGWNAIVAPSLTVPTLIIQGEFDTGQGGVQQLAELYRLVKTPNKLRFRVQCSGQFMQWDNRRRLLQRVSREWIKDGTVAGFSQGEFFIDTAGNLSSL